MTVENLNKLKDELIAREIERNEILLNSGYAEFALSEDEAFNQGLLTFQKVFLGKVVEMIRDGNT
tara:strand:- start:16 stop:210 length:195 start_codon:yes stop_codon:yes gene_type:complete